MRLLYLFVLVSFWGLEAKAQSTFQKLVYNDFPGVRFTGVIPVDTSYYITGTFVDTSLYLRTGILFAKMSSGFEMETMNALKHPDKFFFNDFGAFLLTEDGNFLTSAVVFGPDSSVRVLLVKYSPSGDTLLTREYNSINYPNWEYLVPVELVKGVGGSHGILMGQQEEEHGSFDVSLLTIDSNFEVLNYTKYGSPHVQETARSLVLDSDGGYLIGADRTNLGRVWMGYFSQTSIIKTDSVGNVLWQYLSPYGRLQDGARAMIKTPDGGLIVASGIGIEKPINASFNKIEWDAMIFKLDAARNVVWEAPFRGARTWALTKLVEMVEAPDGSGYVAVGKVVDPEPRGEELYPGSLLVKVSPEGDSLWARHFTFLDGEWIDPVPYDLKPTPDGGYIVVGTTLKVGQHVRGWALKVDEYGCLVPGCHLIDATAEEGKPEINLLIYPNPSADFLNVYLRTPYPSKSANYRILNEVGQVVGTFENISANTTGIIPIHDWPSGIYFIQYIEGGQVVVSEKFIKI